MNKSTRDHEQGPTAAGKILEMPAAHLATYEPLKDGQGRRRIVRHGYLLQRELQTGARPVEAQVPRARDQDPQGPGGTIHFRSTLLPPYLRRSAAMDELLPWLHLKGISTGVFGEALEVLVGPQAR